MQCKLLHDAYTNNTTPVFDTKRAVLNTKQSYKINVMTQLRRGNLSTRSPPVSTVNTAALIIKLREFRTKGLGRCYTNPGN